MSKYTTGEIAKLCGVSVRTVQYYDSRGILSPSALSEGGRRLYSQNDLHRLKVICFLRSIGLSISTIASLLAEENPGSVITLLLDQQARALQEEISERQSRLSTLDALRRELKAVESFSVETINDIAYTMENKKKLRRLYTVMISIGLVMDVIEIGTLVYAIKSGNWLPFAAGMVVVIALGIWVSRFYFSRVSYICPECHEIFRPRLKEAFWARHTPRTRRLTCPVCGKKHFCVETWGPAEKV